MKQAIRWTAATLAVLGAIGMAQAQGGGSGGAGGGAGGSGTPAAGSGTPGSGGTPISPTNGSNAGMSGSKSGSTANTGNSADNGPGVRSSPDTSGSHTVKKAPVKHSHAKHADPMTDPASAAPLAQKQGG